MKKTTILALASAASALATAAASVADELETGETPDNQQQGATLAGDAEPPKRRGRPPGSTSAAAPAQTEATPATTGKTHEELREIIKPLVTEGRGEEVKTVIAKYGASLKEIPADKHAAFEKDIQALQY